MNVQQRIGGPRALATSGAFRSQGGLTAFCMTLWILSVGLLGAACSSQATLTSGSGVESPKPASTGAESTAGTVQPASGAVKVDPQKFGCKVKDDCTSTCDSGCVSIGFAEKHQDTCQNIRAFDCSCVESVCFTDGRPPR